MRGEVSENEGMEEVTDSHMPVAARGDEVMWANGAEVLRGPLSTWLAAH